MRHDYFVGSSDVFFVFSVFLTFLDFPDPSIDATVPRVYFEFLLIQNESLEPGDVIV